MRAIDAIRKAPCTISSDATLAQAALLMDEHVVGALVVIDDDRPVGILTDRDLVVRAVARMLPADARVDAVMTSKPVTLSADADVRDAFKLFHSHPFRRLPLVDAGRVVGMITADDLLINLVSDLAELARPITGQVIFGSPQPHATPAVS
jgi:CBS domain-containing protein